MRYEEKDTEGMEKFITIIQVLYLFIIHYFYLFLFKNISILGGNNYDDEELQGVWSYETQPDPTEAYKGFKEKDKYLQYVDQGAEDWVFKKNDITYNR